MRTQQERLNILSRIVSDVREAGIASCVAEEPTECDNGRLVTLGGQRLTNFASCSYLGLELDERLIEGAVRAVRTHGIQVCASRSYLSSSLYDEFESLLAEIFGTPAIVSPTTTLGHLSAIPTLVDEGDAILLDHQVHASVQMACKVVQAGGTHLEIIPHNGLRRVERRVKALAEKHKTIWYMADGVHSMTGKLAPTREILALLDQYPMLRFYVDDAHGMSWCGPRGTGSILGEAELHPRMVLTTGLGKGFGTGGGLIVLPDEEERRLVQGCGPTMIFGGPLQPPVLGAAIESAKIHLTDEIDDLQADLGKRMALRNEIAGSLGIPMTSSPETPVGLVAMGAIKAGHSLCQRLLADGFYINPAQFPALPMRRAGGRFLLTRHHTEGDIESLMEAIHRHWAPSLKDAGTTPEEVYRAFKIDPPEARLERTAAAASTLHLDTSESIDKLNREEWDRLLGDRGTLGSGAMALYERVFGAEAEAENQWTFRYYVVRDEAGEPVLATCFTKALWKADMLSAAEVSAEVEARREEDPLYLTQHVFGMGCLLSEGDHLYLRDPVRSETGRRALQLLLEAVRRDAEYLGCEMRAIRDVPEEDHELIGLLEEEGLLRLPSPDSLVLRDLGESEDELFGRLSRRVRKHQRREVEPWNDFYTFEVRDGVSPPMSEDEVARLYTLYENVRSQNLGLNTFGLPRDLFPAILESPDWEIWLVRLASDPDGEIVGFGAAYGGNQTLVPLVAGLDYRYVRDHGLYRQVLRHAVTRARELGRDEVQFGFGATLEKQRFGAEAVASSMFLEASDHYVLDALAQHESSQHG